MITTAIIDNCNVQTKNFVEQAGNLPFTKVVTEKKKSFEEAVAECDGRPVSEFFDELRRQIEEHFKNA
jgi:hypothetical protein